MVSRILSTPAAARSEKVLVVEHDPEVRRIVDLALRCEGYTVEHADNSKEVVEILKRPGAGTSLLLLDITLPEEGLDALRRIRRFNADLPIIVLSGATSTMTVVDAMKGGADDFLSTPIDRDQLTAAAQRSLTISIRRSHSHLLGSAPLPGQHLFEGAFMCKLQSLLRQISSCEAPILIQGETGVGKEVIANLVHANSPRSNKPFLKLNCAALPSELVESELFGYEKGAFTGAFKSKPGKFDLADTGALLLDEIGDMDFKLQAKLLQVVQDQRFERLGGEETVSVNVRVMAATHCDLEQAIEDRKFREDLYYRLNVISIAVPALRERTDEILPLARLFVRKHSAHGAALPDVNSALQRELLSYEWPGNIRELENCIRQFCVFRNPEIVINELQRRAMKRGGLRPAAKVGGTKTDATVGPSLEKVTLAHKQIETETIVNALQSTHWNRKRAAALLQVDYKIFLYRMKKLGIDEGSNGQQQLSAAAAGADEQPMPTFSAAAGSTENSGAAAGD